MSLQSHLDSLRKKHAALEAHISELERSPSVDQILVTEAKKKKLALKEEIMRHE